ncbi:MAG: restriction endonuclease [Desulfarculus sp.]|nr:restriction endonuclease [Desulfarculus sp.]
MNRRNILDRWGITAEELSVLVDNNPSLRGVMLGYVAEKKFQDWLEVNNIQDLSKSDDHDRKSKGDRIILYNGQRIIVEVKSLQTATVKYLGEDRWTGKTQVDASDKRPVGLPNGEKLNTTCLLVGEFDLLAVNLYAFGEKWRFAFAKNQELPHSRFSKYTEYQRDHLLATLIEVSWPPEPPFYADPTHLLEELATEKV